MDGLAWMPKRFADILYTRPLVSPDLGSVDLCLRTAAVIIKTMMLIHNVFATHSVLFEFILYYKIPEYGFPLESGFFLTSSVPRFL